MAGRLARDGEVMLTEGEGGMQHMQKQRTIVTTRGRAGSQRQSPHEVANMSLMYRLRCILYGDSYKYKGDSSRETDVKGVAAQHCMTTRQVEQAKASRAFISYHDRLS
jgi:hypothetical protein